MGCGTYQNLEENSSKYQRYGLALAGVSLFLAMWIWFTFEV